MVALRRSAPLRANTEHDFEPEGGGWWFCVRECGSRVYSPDGEPDVGWACEGSLGKGSQLETHTELRSSKRIRPINPERRRRSRTDEETGLRHTYGPVWRFTSHLPCCVCRHVDGTPADHWKTVKTGGRDPANVLPVCAEHNDRHDLGRETWAEKYDVEVEVVLWDAWESFKLACPEQAAQLTPHLPNTRPV